MAQEGGSITWRSEPCALSLAGVVERERSGLYPEGEKDVDNLRHYALLLPVTPWSRKMKEQYNAFLAGREVVLLSDNDDPGRSHVEK